MPEIGDILIVDVPGTQDTALFCVTSLLPHGIRGVYLDPPDGSGHVRMAWDFAHTGHMITPITGTLPFVPGVVLRGGYEAPGIWRHSTERERSE